jgi:Domain of unknown function (DUF3291).
VTVYHLAQINIAKPVADLESPVMTGFVSRLDEINALAERTKGFVWRLKSEAGDASSIRVFDDPQVLINMSVWETLDDLKRFVYRTAHLELLRNREAWFKRLSQQHQAAWWIPAGEFPSPERDAIACFTCASTAQPQLRSRSRSRFRRRRNETIVRAQQPRPRWRKRSFVVQRK